MLEATDAETAPVVSVPIAPEVENPTGVAPLGFALFAASQGDDAHGRGSGSAASTD